MRLKSRVNPSVVQLLILALIGSACTAAERDWENEKVFGINKEAPRATAMPFPSTARR